MREKRKRVEREREEVDKIEREGQDAESGLSLKTLKPDFLFF